MKHMITPVGDQLYRLKANTDGLTSYTINGDIEAGMLELAGVKIPVWMFSVNQIEEDAVRQHIITEQARVMNATVQQATEYLEVTRIAIPRKQIMIEPIVVQ